MAWKFWFCAKIHKILVRSTAFVQLPVESHWPSLWERARSWWVHDCDVWNLHTEGRSTWCTGLRLVVVWVLIWCECSLRSVRDKGTLKVQSNFYVILLPKHTFLYNFCNLKASQTPVLIHYPIIDKCPMMSMNRKKRWSSSSSVALLKPH